MPVDKQPTRHFSWFESLITARVKSKELLWKGLHMSLNLTDKSKFPTKLRQKEKKNTIHSFSYETMHCCTLVCKKRAQNGAGVPVLKQPSSCCAGPGTGTAESSMTCCPWLCYWTAVPQGRDIRSFGPNTQSKPLAAGMEGPALCISSLHLLTRLMCNISK